MLSKQKLEEGYFGLAVAFDGKKQLFSVFCANELEMEENKKDIYIGGKRLCDVCVAMDNGKDIPMSLEVDKSCLLKKGGSQVQIPLGEQPVIIYPANEWYLKTTVSTSELLNLLMKGGRFYNSAVGNHPFQMYVFASWKEENYKSAVQMFIRWDCLAWM